jgi:hypothetical protein
MKIDRIIEAIEKASPGVKLFTRIKGGFYAYADLTIDDLKLLADRAEAADRYEAMLAEAESIEWRKCRIVRGAGNAWIDRDGSAYASALDAFSAGKDS